MAAKIPLPVRKHVREHYEAKVPEMQQRLKEYLGEHYDLVPNTEAFYAAVDNAGQGDNTGVIMLSYFEAGVSATEHLTDGGKDKDAVALFNSLVSARKVSLVVDTQFSECGLRVKDGVYEIVMNPESVWKSVSSMNGPALVREIDIQLLDSGELPLTTRRAIKNDLNPKIAGMKTSFKKMFNKDYTAEYDVLKTLQTIKAATFAEANSEDGWYYNNLARVAVVIGLYFENLADGLQFREFGKDDMLQESFIEATEKGVVRFELIDKLPTNRNSIVAIEDSVFFIRTTVEHFGTSMGHSISEGIVEML